VFIRNVGIVFMPVSVKISCKGSELSRRIIRL